MDPTSTLTSTPQPRKETSKQVFGAIDDSIEYLRDTLLGTDSPVRSKEILEPERGWSEIRPTETKSPIGGKTEIPFNSRDEYQYQQTLKFVKQIDSKVEQVTEMRNVQEEIRFEIAGMNDEQFADKAGYQNKSFRGPFLRTIKNFWDAFKTMLGEKKASLDDRKSIVVERARGKINHATNKNSAAERGGGQTSVFDTPG